MRDIFKIMSSVLLVLMACGQVWAFKLQCSVVDPEGEPMAYANYRITTQADTAKVVTMGTAGAEGEIMTNIAQPGSYVLHLSYIGSTNKAVDFQAHSASEIVDLGTVTMSPDYNVLGEVEVVAQRPLVTKEIDRVGYDVQADVDAPTSNLSDMLRKVPMLSVDSDGTITVNGSSNFQVYKNGRPSKSYSSNAKEIFKAIPASMIKRIEVITEPGSKYDAEGVGAIINIVTVENVSIKGVMGSAGLDATTLNMIPGANLWLSSQIDKVTFSVNGGYHNLNEKNQDFESYSDYVYDNGNRTTTRTRQKGKGNMGYFGAEASYDLDSLNLFTLELNGFIYGIKTRGTSETAMYSPQALMYSYNSLNHSPHSSYFDFDGTFNYQHLMRNPGEMLNASYQISTNHNSSRSYSEYYDMVNMPVNYSGINSDISQNFIEHTFQVDWTRPFRKIHTIELGAKGIIRRNHSISCLDYVGAMTTDNDFSHITDVAALYGQYSAKLGSVGLRAGLRYEYSHLKAKYADNHTGYSSNLNDLVPSASASWQINDGNSLTFNYASRINRPGISYLDPTVNETPTSVSMGNPDLNSAMHHSMKLTYMYITQKFNFNFSTNYDLSNNGITGINYLDDDRMVSTYLNIGHYRALSFNGFLQWTITPKISLMANGGITYTRYTQRGMELSRWTPFAFARYTQRLPWKLNGQLGLFVFGQQPSSVYAYTHVGNFSNCAMWSISLSRNFLKEDRLSVRIEAINPIGRSTRRFVSETINGDYTGISTSTHYHLKGLRLNISYRFGSMGASVKKTARSINNDDMVGGSQRGDTGSSTTGGL